MEPDITLTFFRRARVLVLTGSVVFVQHIAQLGIHESLDVSVCCSSNTARRLLGVSAFDLVVIAVNDKRRVRNGSSVVKDPRLASVPIVALGDPPTGSRAKRLMLTADHWLPGDITPDDFVRAIAAVWKRTRYLRELSPDTGLPGKTWIFEELTRRMVGNRPCSLLFCDIDRFKSVSDVYGFDRAGKFLIALGKALSDAALHVAAPPPAIGHIGGDDFLVICEPEQVLSFARRSVREFEEAADKLYDPTDAQRGYVIIGSQRAALVTLSIGVIETQQEGRRFNSLREIATAVSEMKQVAKSQPGSYVAIDRRSPQEVALQKVLGRPSDGLHDQPSTPVVG